MPPKFKRPLNRYYQRLKNFRVELVCPDCNEALLSADYEKHCRTRHGLDPETQCVWCRGKKFWKRRSKFENLNHLLLCWKKFMVPFLEPFSEKEDDSSDLEDSEISVEGVETFTFFEENAELKETLEKKGADATAMQSEWRREKERLEERLRSGEAEATRQKEQIDRLQSKVLEQKEQIDRLQSKVPDLKLDLYKEVMREKDEMLDFMEKASLMDNLAKFKINKIRLKHASLKLY